MTPPFLLFNPTPAPLPYLPSPLVRTEWCRLLLNVDDPGKDGLFGLHQMEPIGYDGATGDGSLDLHGFDVEIIDDTKLKFWMINHRPPVDKHKKYLDAFKLGANSTVEVFNVVRNSNKMVHVKTITNEAIATPNKLAATGDGGFVMTNDKSGKGRELWKLLYIRS